MATQQRPLSPHLQVYKPQLTSTLSIIHRGSGVLLAVGALLLAGWLLAAAGSAEAFARAQSLLASWPGQVALFGFSAALIYHFLNGIRHLLWDVGWGYEIPKVYASGYAVLTLAAVFTAMLWYAGLVSGGAA